MSGRADAWPIERIQIGERHRRDHGDLTGFAASGEWLRGQTEHCILAVRGKPIVRLTNESTLLLAPVPAGGLHSSKPREFYDLVERLCPAPRYADVFSRYRHNERWDCHGDEAPNGADGGSA